MGTATAAALLAVMLLAGPSVAAVPGVEVTHDPEISPATPVVGQTVTAVNAAWSPSTDNVRATYLWFRCTSADSFDCAQIAEGQSYVVQAADEGQRLLAAIHVQWGNREDWGSSEVSSPVVTSPPPSPPSPPAPASEPVTVTPPPAPSTGDVAGETALKWLAPFPVVRIKGWLIPAGARVTLLTVRAPRGARIVVTCDGRFCPRKRIARSPSTRMARSTRLVHLAPYERLLRGTVRLVISVTRRGYVGKRTIITLRRGKPPVRRDLCLFPGVRRARSCHTT